jgi:DNA ligase D-like protein (predicted polymerase)
VSADAAAEVVTVDGREVRVTNPGKVYFPAAGITKLDLVHYYLAVADGALRAISRRPLVLKRYVDGITGEGFFQKRAPAKRPDWVRTVELSFPSGRTAHELVVTERAQLVWITNLGNIDLHAHPVRADDLEHPDELRVDLDPGPGVPWQTVREVALMVREVLADHGLVGWPKTTGSRGLHVYVRIQRQWGFSEVRRAALAVSREVERRAPGLATSKWWKEERVGVFLDYNQNAKDRTIAAAYSVRPLPDARVSAPLAWEEVPDCEPADFTLHTMPARLAARGDLAAGMDAAAGDLGGLLELAARHEAEGLGGDAPWPPHFRRQRGEPRRVAPSRARRVRGAAGGAGAGEAGPPAAGPTATAPAGAEQAGAARSGPGRAGAAPPAAPQAVEAAATAAPPTGRRRSTMPLVVVAKARTEEEARAGLERWRRRHPAAAAHLQAADVLVDAMRGRSSTWTRIRVNLRRVPESERPPAEQPDPDYDPWRNGG